MTPYNERRTTPGLIHFVVSCLLIANKTLQNVKKRFRWPPVALPAMHKALSMTLKTSSLQTILSAKCKEGVTVELQENPLY